VTIERDDGTRGPSTGMVLRRLREHGTRARVAVLVGLVALVALTLASCGGDGSDGSGDPAGDGEDAGGPGAIAESDDTTVPSPEAVAIDGGALEPTEAPPAEGLTAVALGHRAVRRAADAHGGDAAGRRQRLVHVPDR